MENKNFALPVTNSYLSTILDIKYFVSTHQQWIQDGITIFGAGMKGCEFMALLEEQNVPIKQFCDNNPEKQGGFINQYPILSLKQIISQQKPIRIIIAVENYTAIVKQLEKENLKENSDYVIIYSTAYDDFVKEFERPYNNQFLVFGDCGLTAISITDTEKETLGEMLQKRLGRENTKLLAMHGMGWRAFFNILLLQIQKNMIPKHIICQVNTVIFSGKYHLLPRSQHILLLKKIYQIEGCDSQKFKDYINISEKRFNTFQTDFFTTSPSSQKVRFSEGSLKQYLKMYYMYKLDTKVEDFEYYCNFLNVLRDYNILATLYIPPVNIFLGKRLGGTEFVKFYKNNCELIMEKSKKLGFTVLDLSYSLSAEEFCAIDTPNETANYLGRCKLCEAIISKVQA